MAVVNDDPHPRVLFIGWHEDDPQLREMVAMVPTAKLWDGDLGSVRWDDWDALVGRTEFDFADGFNHPIAVLAFDVRTLPQAWIHEGYADVASGRDEQVSAQFEINDSLPSDLRRLVRDELAPWLNARPARPLMSIGTDGYMHEFAAESTVGLHQPPLWFARDPDGTMIAGAYEHTGRGPVWSLPFLPDHPARWLAAAMREWSEDLPEAFPGSSESGV